MDKFLLADNEKCTGCGLCALACSSVKEGAFVPAKSRVHFVNFARDGRSVPNICFHCEQPACAEACPVEAIVRSHIGAVVVDNATCTGCGECAEACPYGMIELNEGEIAYKCDLCDGNPECVTVCQPKAIAYDVLDEPALKRRLLQMSKKIPEGTPVKRRLAVARSLGEITN